MKTFISLSLLFAVTTACGTDKSDRTSTVAVAIVGDSELQTETASANLSEALEAAGDANESATSGTSLALANEFTRDRSCAVDGSKAVVTIANKFTANNSKDLKNVSIVQTRESSSNLSRSWSKDGSSIACAADNKHASIDFSANQTGLNLNVSFTRTDARTNTITHLKSGTAVNKSSSYTATGDRTVVWTGYTAGTAGSYTIDKKISSSATRVHKRKDKNGVEQTISLKVTTAEADPLMVSVLRDGQGAISTRTIKSGTLTAESDAKIESKFENLQLTFTADSCSPTSGQVTTKIFAAGATDPSAIYLITAADGAYTVSDITDPTKPLDVDDFSYELCNIHNFDF